MIELELSEDVKDNARDGNATGWRLESSLREFPNITPVEFWFECPIHRVDSEYLKALPAQGTLEAGRLRNPKSKTRVDADEQFRMAFNAQCMDGKSVSVKEMMEFMNLSNKTIYERVHKLKDEFCLQKKRIYRTNPDKTNEIRASEAE